MTTRVLSERHVGHLFRTLFARELGDFEGYDLELTVIYTAGKNSHWPAGQRGLQSGVMPSAFLIPERRVAAGAALIDIERTLPTPNFSITSVGARPRFSPSSISLETYRLRTLTVLAHEMFHMIQSWRVRDRLIGDEPTERARSLYARRRRRIADSLEDAHPDWSEARIHAESHARHPDEREAENLALDRINTQSRAIKKGLWDAALPIKDMIRLFEQSLPKNQRRGTRGAR